VHARSLREDLLGIDGVEGADIDGDSESPSGLRIRIAEGADQQLVGQEIRRVLSSHGLGTDTKLPGEASDTHGESVHTDAMASVSDLAAEPSRASTLVSVAEDEDVASRRIIDLTDDPEALDSQADEPLVAAPRPRTTVRSEASVTSIERVSVEEGRSGIAVTIVTTDGRSETDVARSTEGGVDRTVMLVAARLAAPNNPDPIVIDIDERRIEGVDIVMIVLDCNGRVAAGSSVIGAGRAYALARATWAAVAV
jgi:hypothetical protein